MRVRCTRLTHTPEEASQLGLRGVWDDYGLELGREYLVLAIYCFVESSWGRGAVYVIDTRPDPLPTFVPAGLFEVVDATPSQSWGVESWSSGAEIWHTVAIGPPLVLQAHFMEDLADSDPEVTGQFRQLLTAMETE